MIQHEVLRPSANPDKLIERIQPEAQRPGDAIRFAWGREAIETKREVLLGNNMEQIRELGRFGAMRLSPTDRLLENGQIISVVGLST